MKPYIECFKPAFLRVWNALWIWLLLGSLFLSGCGPLDKATRQTLKSSFVNQRYVANIYLGSRYDLEYTNNSVEGRWAGEVFVDHGLVPWYEGHTLNQLQEIDQDLDWHSFIQGITEGQVVIIRDLDDWSDQLVFDVETVERYPVEKTYGLYIRQSTRPRASRVHLVFGRDGMKSLDQNALQRMLDVVLTPFPSLWTSAQKQEFILSHFPNTSEQDLSALTGFSQKNVLDLYYTELFSQTSIDPVLKSQLVEILSMGYEFWYQDAGIWLRDVRIGQGALILDCSVQQISQPLRYHSPDLRAALIFFDGVTELAKRFGRAFAAVSDDTLRASFETLVFTISYPYFDQRGRRFNEEITYSLATRDVRYFAEAAITQQELADRSRIIMGSTPMTINLRALQAVQQIRYPSTPSWKVVEVELEDWWHEESQDSDIVVIKGAVKNTGTWIAEDIEITVEAYDKYGFEVRSESTTLYGLLKPGEIETFEISISREEVRRFSRPVVTWEEVE